MHRECTGRRAARLARLPAQPWSAHCVCVQTARQSWYALPSVFPAPKTSVNRRRAGVTATLLLLLAFTSPVRGDATDAEAPSADVDWEEVKRESREAIEVWRKAARAAARATWTEARARSEETLAATEDESENAIDAVRDGSATVLDSTREGAKQAWEDATEESKQLWRQAKPKVAGAVVEAAREGGKALDAARQAGRTFWQVLTAEDAGEDEE